MNVLAINGSPGKNGFTSKITNQILEGAKEAGHNTEVIYLADLNLRDCAGCRACQKEDTAKCVFRDDIVKIEDGISKNDLIIWATPTHWGNVSAYMLRAFERLFGFLLREQTGLKFPIALRAKGKKAILVTSCTTPYPFNILLNQSRAAFDRIKEMCRYSGQKIIKTFVLPGTLSMKEIPQKYLDRARNIGKGIK